MPSARGHDCHNTCKLLCGHSCSSDSRCRPPVSTHPGIGFFNTHCARQVHSGRSQQKHLPSFTCFFATSRRKNTPSPWRHPNRLEESQSSSRTCSWRAESDTCGEDDFCHVGLILGTCQFPSCNLTRRILCPNSRPSSDRGFLTMLPLCSTRSQGSCRVHTSRISSFLQTCDY